MLGWRQFDVWQPWSPIAFQNKLKREYIIIKIAMIILMACVKRLRGSYCNEIILKNSKILQKMISSEI